MKDYFEDVFTLLKAVIWAFPRMFITVLVLAFVYGLLSACVDALFL